MTSVISYIYLSSSFIVVAGLHAFHRRRLERMTPDEKSMEREEAIRALLEREG